MGGAPPGAKGRRAPWGAEAPLQRSGLSVVLRRDGLLRAPADVLSPKRLLPLDRPDAAARGAGGRLLRVRLRRCADHGVAPAAVPRLALHAPGLADAAARVR